MHTKCRTKILSSSTCFLKNFKFRFFIRYLEEKMSIPVHINLKIAAFLYGMARKGKRKFWVAVISAKNHKRQRRKRQSVTAKREKSQTPKVLATILTLPNQTKLNLT